MILLKQRMGGEDTTKRNDMLTMEKEALADQQALF